MMSVVDHPPPSSTSARRNALVKSNPVDVMVNTVAFELAPPEFASVTFAVPAVAIRLAGTAAVTCVALTNVVTSAVPFQETAAPEAKLVLVTVRVTAGPRAFVCDGLKLVIAGAVPVPLPLPELVVT